MAPSSTLHSFNPSNEQGDNISSLGKPFAVHTISVPKYAFSSEQRLLRLGAFQPLWGFRRGDTVVGSTKHAWDWSYHSVTPKDFTDVVATPDLERIKLMGAQSLASSNAYFQGAVRQAESWKRASDKADNALRRQQKKYATLEKKLKRKEEELGESNAELVVLRAEKDKAIDNYLDSEEFAQSMRIRDDSVFPEFF
ncbi:uncharacterized protein LOC141679851 [Apium graveolens]|uniref:uncharacterized protein LOC141679851 n=1 Tax=Apium graveolens TaxID=4045 RepID=UPI003D7A5F34